MRARFAGVPYLCITRDAVSACLRAQDGLLQCMMPWMMGPGALRTQLMHSLACGAPGLLSASGSDEALCSCTTDQGGDHHAWPGFAAHLDGLRCSNAAAGNYDLEAGLAIDR
jgi:hypothetical protein